MAVVIRWRQTSTLSISRGMQDRFTSRNRSYYISRMFGCYHATMLLNVGGKHYSNRNSIISIPGCMLLQRIKGQPVRATFDESWCNRNKLHFLRSHATSGYSNQRDRIGWLIMSNHQPSLSYTSFIELWTSPGGWPQLWGAIMRRWKPERFSRSTIFSTSKTVDVKHIIWKHSKAHRPIVYIAYTAILTDPKARIILFFLV